MPIGGCQEEHDGRWRSPTPDESARSSRQQAPYLGSNHRGSWRDPRGRDPSHHWGSASIEVIDIAIEELEEAALEEELEETEEGEDE
jgi:hypothetical protein